MATFGITLSEKYLLEYATFPKFVSFYGKRGNVECEHDEYGYLYLSYAGGRFYVTDYWGGEVDFGTPEKAGNIIKEYFTEVYNIENKDPESDYEKGRKLKMEGKENGIREVLQKLNDNELPKCTVCNRWCFQVSENGYCSRECEKYYKKKNKKELRKKRRVRLISDITLPCAGTGL